jgi:hypothetical protein
LVDRLGELNLSVHVEHLVPEFDEPLQRPSPVYVQADSIAELRDALAEADVRYVGYAAGQLAAQANQIGLGTVAAPPADGAPVEHLEAGAGRLRFEPGPPPGDGLCRISVLGRPSYLYRSDQRWFHTDHADGILYALATQGVTVLRWRKDRTTSREEIGTVFVDLGAPLPPLPARALVLCSGLPIEFGRNAQTAIYRNVPMEVASLVARSVRQQLDVIA